MSRSLPQFLDQFVFPLLGGGDVAVAGPIRPREFHGMLEHATALHDPSLGSLRLRRARLLVAEPELPEVEGSELALWVALYNVLAIDHPERSRVWARGVAWRRAESMTRSLLMQPRPTTLGEGLARHVAVGSFNELRRTDTTITTPAGEMRYYGQELPRSRLRSASLQRPGAREDDVVWRVQAHFPESKRLLDDVMHVSPLTCLVGPLHAPDGWSPLSAVAYLQDRAYARAVCHRWAAHREWIRVGAAVTHALLASLPGRQPDATEVAPRAGMLALAGEVLPSAPRDVAAVVGSLIHLHFLKVLELEARLGVAVGSRDPGIQFFLALPVLLPRLEHVLGSPVAGVGGRANLESAVHRRWSEYLDHLEELLPRGVVDEVMATLMPRMA